MGAAILRKDRWRLGSASRRYVGWCGIETVGLRRHMVVHGQCYTCHTQPLEVASPRAELEAREWPCLPALHEMAEDCLIRIDGFYLYRVGMDVHPLMNLEAGQKFSEVVQQVYTARFALESLVPSALRLRTSIMPANQLLAVVNNIVGHHGEPDYQLNVFEISSLRQSLSTFEAVLNSELAISDLYLVSEKGGLNVRDLIFAAHKFMPDDLPTKVPDALADVQQATKCIAFELPTACAFHLFRACEAVLRVYWDSVTNGRTRPKQNNMGDYLKELTESDSGDVVVLSALRDLKNLHRNPLIHPENSLQTTDEALALLGHVRAAVTWMLKAIPSPSQPTLPGLGATAAEVSNAPPA